MKVALVHDWLNNKMGGGELVLEQLAEMYPEAPIYTLAYNPETIQGHFDEYRIRPSYLQRFPGWLRRRQRYLLPLIPSAVEQFDLSEFDVVISSSTAFAKGVITKPETLHICYCHSPMRFAWDYWPAYVNEQHVGLLRRMAIHLLMSRLRLWDFYSAPRVDCWVANSKVVAGRIEKYYHRQADAVIYPGAITEQFKAANEKGDYFVTLASLTPYKKIDLAIKACNQLGRKLVVIGDGADRARLEELAGPTIEFAGRVSNSRRAELVAGAQALLFPNEEDFGIAPIEAMASGTPVIAYGKGGLTETVVEGKTGTFFGEPTAESLAGAIKDFKASDYRTEVLVSRAQEFGMDKFRDNFRQFVEKNYQAFKK